jgi:DNA repair protein RecN (Recombination protein N)
MLLSLRLKDFALVEALELSFGEGLTLLSGETGAGKSILVEALGQVAGGRAEPEMVRHGAAEAVVEAAFRPSTDDGEALGRALASQGIAFSGEVRLLRRIPREGRSGAFVNGTAVPAAFLREVGGRLLKIHGQNQSQSLADEGRQREILDALPEVAPHARKTAEAHRSLEEAVRRLESLRRSESERARRLEELRQKMAEIDRVSPREGEEEELLAARDRLRHAEEIAEAAGGLASLLGGGEGAAGSLLREALRHLRRLCEVDAAWVPYLKDLEGASAVLASVGSEAERTASDTAFDPAALERIEERLQDLDRLKRRYGPSLEDVLKNRRSFEEEAGFLSGGAASESAAAEAVEAAFARYREAAHALTEARAAAALPFAARVAEALRPLALEKARFEVERRTRPLLSPADAAPWGQEEVRFLFSANPGEPLKPLSKIASGGELSRTYLALLTEGAAVGPETLVFDEVDAGIGGRPAERVGRRLRELGRRRQVLCITHLPQIAAFAHHHVLVRKETRGGRTTVRASLLGGEARLMELARMLAGEKVTETAVTHARELLRMAAG